MRRLTIPINTYGINNLLTEYELVEKGFLADAVNVDISDNSNIRRRQGYSNILQGDIHSLWSNGQICLFREGTALKQLLEDYSTRTLRDDLTPHRKRMSYLSVLPDIVYYSDGITTGVVQNDFSRSWGLDKPTFTCSGSGEYRVTLVYRREDGQISGAEIPKTGNNITNISVSEDPTVKYIDVYATVPNGEALYYCKSIPNGQTSTSISEDEIKPSLPLQTLGLSKPPAGDILEYYNGRVYIVFGNVIWYSEPFAYELFDLSTNYLMFEDNITMLNAVKDGMWVATTKKTYFLSGDTPPFKRLEKADYGAVKGTAQKVSADYIGLEKIIYDTAIIWASSSGICVGFDSGNMINLTNKNYRFPKALQGASLFRQDSGLNLFLVSFQDAKNNY